MPRTKKETKKSAGREPNSSEVVLAWRMMMDGPTCECARKAPLFETAGADPDDEIGSVLRLLDTLQEACAKRIERGRTGVDRVQRHVVERLRIGSASIVFSDGWIPNQRVLHIRQANVEQRDVGESVHGVVVRSPRGTGAFEIEIVPNALDDAGVRELAAIDRAAALARIHATGLEAFAPLVSRPFDCSQGTGDGVAWYAFTFFWRTKPGPTTSQLERDWLLAVATETEPANRDLVLASYRSTAKPGADGVAGEAALDIFDCEEMVRTIRFDPSAGLVQ